MMRRNRFSLLIAALLLCFAGTSALTVVPAQMARRGGIRVSPVSSPTPTPTPEPGEDGEGPGTCSAPCWYDEATGLWHCPC